MKNITDLMTDFTFEERRVRRWWYQYKALRSTDYFMIQCPHCNYSMVSDKEILILSSPVGFYHYNGVYREIKSLCDIKTYCSNCRRKIYLNYTQDTVIRDEVNNIKKINIYNLGSMRCNICGYEYGDPSGECDFCSEEKKMYNYLKTGVDPIELTKEEVIPFKNKLYHKLLTFKNKLFGANYEIIHR